jgi:hypothetical protein
MFNSAAPLRPQIPNVRSAALRHDRSSWRPLDARASTQAGQAALGLVANGKDQHVYQRENPSPRPTLLRPRFAPCRSAEWSRTAPVSHQKQTEQTTTNTIEIKRNRSKINGAGRYPAAHNGLVAGRALSESTTKSNVFRLRTLTHRCEVHQTFRMPVGPPDPTPIYSCSSTSRQRGAIRPICTPQLPSSHTRALNFFHTGEVQGSIPCASTIALYIQGRNGPIP